MRSSTQCFWNPASDIGLSVQYVSVRPPSGRLVCVDAQRAVEQTPAWRLRWEGDRELTSRPCHLDRLWRGCSAALWGPCCLCRAGLRTHPCTSSRRCLRAKRDAPPRALRRHWARARWRAVASERGRDGWRPSRGALGVGMGGRTEGGRGWVGRGGGADTWAGGSPSRGLGGGGFPPSRSIFSCFFRVVHACEPVASFLSLPSRLPIVATGAGGCAACARCWAFFPVCMRRRRGARQVGSTGIRGLLVSRHQWWTVHIGTSTRA